MRLVFQFRAIAETWAVGEDARREFERLRRQHSTSPDWLVLDNGVINRHDEEAWWLITQEQRLPTKPLLDLPPHLSHLYCHKTVEFRSGGILRELALGPDASSEFERIVEQARSRGWIVRRFDVIDPEQGAQYCLLHYEGISMPSPRRRRS